MGPYNHDESNIVLACGMTRDEFEEYGEYSTPTLILQKCPKRFLALQLQAAINVKEDKKLTFICQNSKFRKALVPKIEKNVHPALSKIVTENAEDLIDHVTSNYILFNFAVFHHKIINALHAFYNKKSKIVEFLDNNYTKEELLLVLSYAFMIKQRTAVAEKLMKGEEEEVAKKLIKMLGENLNTIEFDVKEYTEEELQITPWAEEKVNRDIDQNIGNPEWLKATNIYNLFGVHSECAKTTHGIEILSGLDILFNNDYTDIERACHLENILWNVHRHNENEYTEGYAFVKMVMELNFNKLNWRHQFALHDRVGRVLLLKQNKPTREDIMYIMQNVF